MNGVAFESLDRAIAMKAPLTLSAEVDGQPVEIAGKFIADSVEDAHPGIWVQPSTSRGNNATIFAKLVSGRISVMGNFCENGTKIVFETTIEKYDKHHWLNDRVAIEALLIAAPDELHSPEFRGAKRYRINDGTGGVYAKLFRRDGGVSKEIEATLWDLSSGGVSFLCPTDKQLMSTSPEELFAIALNFRGKKIVVPARFAHARAFSSRTIRLGMRFDFANPVTAQAKDEIQKVCASLDAEGK